MAPSNFSRREFLGALSSAGAAALASCAAPGKALPRERPNILWITSEDNGPFLGCYGDPLATTPNLDRLASEGILYENAYSTAPVCAPARCTIISGMYPPSLGTQHMRSKEPVPPWVPFFPKLLRQAGYYCTNCVKKDYNMPEPPGVWDESGRRAHYKKRPPGKPFFAVFNITVSHESRIHRPEKHLRHDPSKFRLPPYQPDTPEMRHDWAQYYDKVEEMDRRVGKLLAELEREGLAGETIVFYYSDHGGVLPRSKRFCYDSGLHVPMILRFPPKFRRLAPGAPGTRLKRIVSFVDLAPTVLSLAGVPIPSHMQGKAFLGEQAARPREYAYSFRGRMDERYDMVRTVRDGRYRYRRNFMPHRIYGQHIDYLWRAPSMRSWEREWKAGRCNPTQSAFWGPKPPEELYDTWNDPWEVKNLAGDPALRDTLLRMRRACREWMLDIRDTGVIPEGLMLEWSKKRPLYDITHDRAFPMEEVLHAAWIATERNPARLPEILAMLRAKNPLLRYWGATGVLVLGRAAAEAVSDLGALLADPAGDVRVTAAEALCALGRASEGLPLLEKELFSPNPWVVLHAANSLESLGPAARPARAALERAARTSANKYIHRAAAYTAGKFQ